MKTYNTNLGFTFDASITPTNGAAITIAGKRYHIVHVWSDTQKVYLVPAKRKNQAPDFAYVKEVLSRIKPGYEC